LEARKVDAELNLLVAKKDHSLKFFVDIFVEVIVIILIEYVKYFVKGESA
jgi:hypothetical protein